MEENAHEILDYEEQERPKQRHGCVTAWLIFVIVANSITALIYFVGGQFVMENSPAELTMPIVLALGFLGGVNVACAVLLFKWKKWGFWGFIITSVIAMGINISIGLGIAQSLAGLIGIGVLLAILQIKSDGVSAWNNLE